MVDWAKLLKDKIENADAMELCMSVPEPYLFAAIIADTVATFEVHDSVTDEELEEVFAQIETIIKHDEAHARFEKECERLGI
jgi:hypothetical protein